MTRLCWWLVDALSRMLESEEREAVRGDLTESRVNGGQALSEVFGLVVQRQAALWIDWRPWLGLMGVVVPLGMLLSLVSRWWADRSAIHWWFYVNNWTWGYLESPGARRDLVQISAGVFLNYVTLACWSWTTGFVLGSLSRRTIRVIGTLFCMVLIGELLAGPQQHNAVNDAVFSLAFYGVWLPVILRIVLVLAPTLWGMHGGFRFGTLRLLPTILWAVVVATLTALTAKGLEYSLIFSGSLRRWPLPRQLYPGPDGQVGTADDLLGWQVRLLPFVMAWPVAYMVATASWRRFHAGTAGR